MARKKRPTKKAAPKKAAKKKTAKRVASRKAAAQIDITVEADAWPRNASAVCERASQAALDACALRKDVNVSVLLTTDTAVRQLNGLFRGKDKPTNVLSFPAAAEDTPPGAQQLLGDIAVAYGVCAQEAKTEGKTLTAHLSHLVVHGVLHLLGYDHERESEADIMERWERKILARLGISDPYADTVPDTLGAGPRVKKPARKPPRKKRSAR
jgi:probable rRNA maturation factor